MATLKVRRPIHPPEPPQETKARPLIAKWYGVLAIALTLLALLGKAVASDVQALEIVERYLHSLGW